MEKEPKLTIIGSKLAYVLAVKISDAEGKRDGVWEYYVDAISGDVLKKQSLIRGF